MHSDHLPAEELKRLAALESYNILDSLPEEDFDAITSLASQICQTPISLITLVDDTRQWFKSAHGLSVQETPKEGGFCTYTVSHPVDLSIVDDARVSEQFADHPLVTGDPRLVFYAGAPLVDEQGYAIGSLCVIDTQARQLTPAQRSSLGMLARQVVNLLTLRRQNNELQRSQELLQLEQAALARSEMQFRTLIEEATVATCLFLGRELRVTVANGPMLAIWGKGPNQIGRTLAEILPEIANQPFLAILDDVYTSGQTYSAKGVRADLVYDGVLGSYYFDFTYKPLVDESGQVYGILQIAVDVTQQVLAQQQVADDAALFSTLANSIGQLAWIANAEGWIYWYNDRWYEYTGTTLSQMQGWGWQAVHHPDYVDNITHSIRQAWQAGHAFEMTFPLRAKDGQYRQFLTRVYPIRDASGHLLQWVGTNTDVEAQKQQEAQLENLVQQRTQELTLANQDLKRSNDNLQQFAYVASHDLQEPLRKIQSFSSLLVQQLDTQLDESSRNYLERITAAGARMSMLIRDLLTYSRISTRQQAFGPVSLQAVLTTVLTTLDWAIQQTGAQITMDDLPMVNGDESQLGQLFQNLLANALKFVHPGQRPFIQIQYFHRSLAELPPQVHPSRQAPHYHQISVRDNGVGFDTRFLDRIFQVFQRLHGKNEYPGTGVGLAICQRVLENHGGGITADSQPGQGATFCIYLPA